MFPAFVAVVEAAVAAERAFVFLRFPYSDQCLWESAGAMAIEVLHAADAAPADDAAAAENRLKKPMAAKG